MEDWDWELLHESQETPPQSTIIDQQNTNSSNLSLDFDVDNEKISGVFQSNYFSIDEDVEEEEEEGDSSDNPSWIDPSTTTVSGTRIRNSISSSNSDSSGPTSLHLIQSHHSTCEFTTTLNHHDHDHHHDHDDDDQVEAKDEGENGEGGGGEGEGEEKERENEANTRANEEEKEKEKIVWWKVPMEVLKYCVVKVSPIWSISMAAAALMGFIILRRRYLYKIKRKTLGLQLKVTLDDKKESQFMSRVARLNEAFSVVKRVPMVRPSLPAPGLAPWPVMSMR